MDNWKIIFYQTANDRELVKEFIDSLNLKKQAKVYQQIGLLRKYGLRLPFPYLRKLAGTKRLWELRVSSYRIFLSPVLEKNILLIHAIVKKTQKTPKKELKIAESRLKDFIRSVL